MVSLRSALQAFSNPVEETVSQDDDPTVCPTCEKRFKTPGGMSSRLRTARSCSWYKKGKLKALVMPGQFADDIVSEEVNDPLPQELLRRSGAEQAPPPTMKTMKTCSLSCFLLQKIWKKDLRLVLPRQRRQK